MLVPVIGLIEAGEQARADRYTYLPQIGLYILITWGISDLVALIMTHKSGSRSVTSEPQPTTRGSREARADGPQGRGYKPLCVAIAAAIIVALSCRAFVQTSYWKNSEMLWNHTLAVTTDNDMAHNSLGDFFLRRGELDSAISHFEIALEIRSRNAAAHYNFGGALIENKLGSALARKGRLSEAIGHYEKAVKLRPDYGDPYFNLGSVLFQQGRTDEAIAQWQKALATQPNDAGFHTTLGTRSLKRDYRKMQSLSTSTRHGSSRATSWLETTWRGSSRLLPMLQSAMANAQSRWPNKPCNSRAAKMRTISGLSRLSIRRLVGFLRLLQSPNKLQP
jgi:tetratricopeptide (TPR) repeat protein